VELSYQQDHTRVSRALRVSPIAASQHSPTFTEWNKTSVKALSCWYHNQEIGLNSLANNHLARKPA